MRGNFTAARGDIYISHISLTNFRNYERLEFDLLPGMTLFHGENGAGKSNLLEAMYMLAVARSPRASSDRELIRRSNGEGEFYTQVAADVERSGDAVNLQVNFRSTNAPAAANTPAMLSVQKYFRVNGVARRASALIGNLNAVMFSADDLEIVYGAPSVRRRYLNILISQTDREYLGAIQRYERVVRQRNHLLRQIREGAARVGELAFWDDELVKEGSRIVAQRLDTVKMLSEGASPMYAGLSGGSERLDVAYLPNVELVPDVSESGIADALRMKLEERRRQELARGMTVTGPHRDDLALTLDGLDAAGFASRGQTRTAVLALKLAEAAFLRERRGREPVILLDDVLSELDAARREQVLGHAAQYHQALITTADADTVAGQLPNGTARFGVRRGQINLLD
ncbi:MAG: DNA replication/repair protein RecF [Chloroflexi bacterium]|nr:DNA replication/repair protein RecF [Chloroflexota bacterium]